VSGKHPSQDTRSNTHSRPDNAEAVRKISANSRHGAVSNPLEIAERAANEAAQSFSNSTVEARKNNNRMGRHQPVSTSPSVSAPELAEPATENRNAARPPHAEGEDSKQAPAAEHLEQVPPPETHARRAMDQNPASPDAPGTPVSPRSRKPRKSAVSRTRTSPQNGPRRKPDVASTEDQAGDVHSGTAPKPSKARKKQDAEVLGTLLEGIEEGVAHVSLGGAILYANPKFAELLGARPGEMVEGRSTLRDFLSPVCWGVLETALYQGARETTEGTLRVEDRDGGGVRTVRLLLSPVHWKKATTIKMTANETTELLEKNRELQDKEASLHSLSARILQLQDEERRRIARDLHDITGQELAVVIMALTELAKHPERPGAEVQEKITDAAGLVRKIEDEIRTLSYLLHPPLLDEFGLGSALNWYSEGFTKRSGIEVKVEVEEGLPRLKPEKEMALFRVVQESLTNVLRHSGSKMARILVSSDAEFVVLSVEDEGRGIDRKKIERVSSAMESGVGIAGMRERLQQFGGSLKVRPREKGTEVEAMVPIGEAPPIEELPSEEDILRMAKALGYKGESTGTPCLPRAVRSAEGRKRVLIADDHEVTRQGIRSLLNNERDMEICGEAKDGLEVIMQARQLDPDLIIMDLHMPHVGGFSAANRIRRSGLRAKILFFTTNVTHGIEKIVRIGGFDGFVQKTDGARDLVRGVRAVLDGNKFFGAEILKASAKGA
jgi:PAS domain S-box-containing protein